MKLIVNQAYDNMGLQGTQILGRSSTAPCATRRKAATSFGSPVPQGVKGAVAGRDSPFGDYSQGRPEDQPRKRSRLKQDRRG